MSATRLIRVDDKGRTVVPAEVRERFGWSAGTTFIVLEGAEAKNGSLIMSQDAALGTRTWQEIVTPDAAWSGLASVILAR